MHLSNLKVQNYRSIKNLDINFLPGKNIVVGKNNAGKSNIIKAIDLVLGESSPTYDKSENITLHDFHSREEETNGRMITKGKDEIIIMCTLKRNPDENLNYDEINQCFGTRKFPTLVENNNDLQQLSDSIFHLNQSTTNYIDGKVTGARSISLFQQELNDKFEFAYLFRAKVENEKIWKNMYFLYRTNSAANRNVCFSCPIRPEFLMSAIIPSFRDPSSQLRLNSRSWYGKMMKKLTETHPRIQEVQDALEAVRDASNNIFGTIQTTIQTDSLGIAFPGIDLYLQFSDEKKVDLYKNTKIYLNDGVKTPLEHKGSGIQSATVIGLFNYYIKHINTLSSALLCIEEPELYLHPHARRVISDKLDIFCNGNQHQVILTTHSTEFIRSTDPTLNILLTSKGENGTIVKRLLIKTLKKILTDENLNEIFFADKIILCEGFDKYLIKWISDRYFNGYLDQNNISVLSVGGKNNFSLFSKLIGKIGIDHYIISDFDYLLRDKIFEETLYNDIKKNDSIINMPSEFFQQSNIWGNHHKSLLKDLIDFRTHLKNSNPNMFYRGKKTSDFGELEPSINQYLESLRENNIFILRGEIEDLFIAQPSGKINLEKIFNMNEKLFGDKQECIENLIHSEQLIPVLEKIFGVSPTISTKLE